MWVWDSSQQVLATQGAVYVQGHCLQEQRLYKQLHCLQALGPLQEHTTFRESLVCYTSPPGEVYVLGVLPGVFVIRFVGFRGRSGCGCCVCWMVSAGAEAGCGAARAWQLCGFGILPNKSLQRKGPCMYRAIACKSSVCINSCTACKL